MGLRERDELRYHDRRLAEIEARVSRYPVREASSGAVDAISVITGQADGAVTSGDATFSVDNVTVLAGVDPGDPVTVQNTLAQSYGDNELLVAYQFESGGDWHTDKVGSGTGSVVAEFELTEDMGYADTYKLAKPLDGSHNLDTGATAIRLLDLDGKWYGKAAYTSTAGSERGYRFFARFVTADHASSGIAGWEIIAGEGPSPIVRAELVTWTSTSDVTMDVSPDRALGGGWSAGRLPEEESGSYDITATDEDNLAEDSAAGAVFMLAWSRADETYRIVAKVAERIGLIRVKGKPTSGVTNGDATFTLGTLVAVCGDLPSSSTITVTNEPAIDASTSDDVFAMCDLSAGSDDTDQWTTADAGNLEAILRGLPNYNAGNEQVIWNDSGTLEWNDIVSADLVTDVEIAASQLRYVYKTFKMLSAGTGATNVKIEDVTTCS